MSFQAETGLILQCHLVRIFATITKKNEYVDVSMFIRALFRILMLVYPDTWDKKRVWQNVIRV